MALRFFAIGDIHHNMTKLQKAIDFAKQAQSSGKCDFIISVGDLVSSTADLTQLKDVKAQLDRFGIIGKEYFVPNGNHDVAGSECYSPCAKSPPGPTKSCYFRQVFGAPDQLYIVTKDSIEYQILTIGLCSISGTCTGLTWSFDFTNPSLDKKKPSIVVHHGPLVKPSDTSCGAWDSCHTYAISENLKGSTDTINMLASYSGHIHAARETWLNGRLYVIQDSINGSRCSGAAARDRFIGYTKITPNTDGTYKVEYQNMEFVGTDGITKTFVDPFPEPAQLTVRLTINPSTITVGQPVNITAVVSGGTAPYIYSWTGLPSPCSGTTGTITCSPNTAGTYNIGVTVTDSTGAKASTTGTLVVNRAVESIVVTNPATGAVYRVGEPRVVRWTHTLGTGAHVKIELLRAGVVVKTITSSTPNDNAFAWTVPSVKKSSDYQIRVKSTTNSKYFGTSGKFTIK